MRLSIIVKNYIKTEYNMDMRQKNINLLNKK